MIRTMFHARTATAILLSVLLLLSSSSVRGDDDDVGIPLCTLHIVNYSIAPVDLSLCDGINNRGCYKDGSRSYSIPAGGQIEGVCVDEYACTLLVGNSNDNYETILCNNVIVFHDDSSGAQQNCYSTDGLCYVPPGRELEGGATPPTHLRGSGTR